MLNGKQAPMAKARTSFSGSKKMGAFLLETHKLTRSTSQLGLAAEVLDPTVLRCLKWDGLRLWIKMAKLCGLPIRHKLFAREVTNILTIYAQIAITKKQ